ncbi:MAG: nuclease-related domain-containing protein [Thermotogota bacterium]|nr:nuclease-related domain-containing protein [Thermotogota bacterium]
MVINLANHNSFPENPIQKAGIQAEKQVAYLLKSYFEDARDIHILNGLRLNISKDINAQFDHLVFHKKGVFIIESKSVTTKVKITPQQEWLRLIDGHWKGMSSPINQVKRQTELLRKFLQENRKSLLGEIKFLLVKEQPGFKNMKIDPIVAISERGMILGYRKTDVPVMKADAVPSYIKDELSKNFPKGIMDKIMDVDWDLSGDELKRTVQFLSDNHEPYDYNVGHPFKQKEQEPKQNKYWCYRCKKEISYKIAKYCFDRKDIFGGKAYCYECQKIVRKER